MIEEQGRVVAVEPGAVWVQTQRRSTCSGCVAKNGCGQGLMERLDVRERSGLVRAVSALQLQVGDAVVLGIEERVLLRGALLVYLFPLLMMLIAAAAAAQWSASEPWIIAAGLGGFVIAWGIVRLRSRRVANDPSLQPVVLRAMLAGSPGMQ
ncbi:SoxR reducing system RseC family protein [Pseudomonas stutzeri]|uniref:SoxR reducing system RseC family protein n=1 Tax=Pseudomonas TaxID=286 RepID=UPI00051CEE19|nr:MULTISPECIES: SoxR reducing system RseC family protein [Pseudomonas]KGK84503.1 alginate regulatory protein [Stutzerimonas degradans]MCQ4234052.1 SoxR reducing system RseC family protein [Stutzerimonas degradans]MCQ4265810.1 SoxR reducing system RseC family protein [Stutzerimonas degradans]OOE09242.1 transcriptional regulator [Stutzerimonas degradans]QCT95746.1 transcriptional regulator [Stutzerimonas degradans]